MGDTMKIEDLLLDDEFEALLPALTTKEYNQLVIEIERDDAGFRHPLIVWKERELLLDGHNRYHIWDTCHRGITDKKPEIEMMSFPDRTAVKIWMYKNQFARRNLTPMQMSYLRGKMHEAEKRDIGAPIGNANRSVQLDQDEPIDSKPIGTAQKIAEITGVSSATIKRDAQKAILIDKAEEEKPGSKSAILSGEMPMPKPETKPRPAESAEERISGGETVAAAIKDVINKWLMRTEFSTAEDEADRQLVISTLEESISKVSVFKSNKS